MGRRKSAPAWRALEPATLADRMSSLEASGEVTDVHRLRASHMFDVPYAQVTDEQRRAAKAAGYYRIYNS